MSGFPEADGLPERVVGTKPAARFDCPACGESLRMRPGSAGRAIDCPACGAGLILSRDAEGAVTAAAVGSDRKRGGVPVLPLALGGVGIACAAAAGWIVLGAGDGGEPAIAPPAPEQQDVAAAAEEPVDPVPDPDPVVPDDETEPAVADAAESIPIEEPEPPPEPVAPTEPARPPVAAPRPSADIDARRLARRLDAELASFRMTRPAPLAQAVEDVEDLLRVRVRVGAGRSAPVRVEFVEPVTVRAVLDEFARQAGLRVVVDDTAVRLTDR